MSIVNLSSELRLNNDVVSHASPTTTLRTHLTQDLGGTTTVAVINAVRLVDTGGSERDSASISSTDWSLTNITNGRRATCSKTISITANYSIARVRLYAGTHMYFEYTLPSSVSVTSGSQVTVSITIDVTLSITHTAGGTLVSTSVTNSGADIIIRRFITGEKRGKRINRIGLVYGGEVLQYITGTVSTDTTNYRVTLSASITPTSNITINEYDIIDEDYVGVAAVILQTLTLSAGATHTWTVTIQL